MAVRHLSVTTKNTPAAQVRRRTYERDEQNLLHWIFYAYRTYAAVLSLHARTLNRLWNDKQPSKKLKEFFNIKSGFVFNRMT